jgi:hypothetical protein
MKKTLIVVHGMGQHDDASLKKSVEDAFKAAFKLYPPLQGTSPGSVVDLVPVSYNAVFDKYRKKPKTPAASLADQLAAVDTSVPFVPRAVSAINGLEASLAKDTFFTTHWLDVILYYLTLLGERVRLQVAEQIATSIARVGGANVHVLAHSLGTAVVHDTLAKSYGPANLVSARNKVLNLSPVQHRLGGLHMVANVSRALQTFMKAGESIVRPGPLGCLSSYTEYRHKLDPIPRIKPFDPTDNDGWVPHDAFRLAYRLIQPSSVTAANVHDLGHYLAIPDIHLHLFRQLFGFKPTAAERQSAEAAYDSTTIEGKARALQTAFGDLKPAIDEDALRPLLEAAKALKQLVQGFGEKF